MAIAAVTMIEYRPALVTCGLSTGRGNCHLPYFTCLPSEHRIASSVPHELGIYDWHVPFSSLTTHPLFQTAMSALDNFTTSIKESPVFWSVAVTPLLLAPVIWIMFGDDIRNVIRVYLLRGQADDAMKMAGGVGGKLQSL